MSVSLDDAKAHVNFTGTGTENDGELLNFLDAATELVREEAGVYAVQSYTETVWPDCGVALLSHTPVVSVTSVVSDGETLTGWTSNAYGMLTGVRGWRKLTVTYTAGTAVDPARFDVAVLMVTARLWESQRGAASGPLGTQDGEVFTPGMQGILGEVRALLGRSGGVGVVA